MKFLNFPWFLRRLAGAALILAGGAPPLFAQFVYPVSLGKIVVDVTLDGGSTIPMTQPQIDFAQFFMDPAEITVAGVGHLDDADKSDNLTARSPVAGDNNYPDSCLTPMYYFNCPLTQLIPIKNILTGQPTPMAPHSAEFIVEPDTSQNPLTPAGILDVWCLPYWVDCRLDLFTDSAHPAQDGRKTYYLNSLRSKKLLPNNAYNASAVTPFD